MIQVVIKTLTTLPAFSFWANAGDRLGDFFFFLLQLGEKIRRSHLCLFDKHEVVQDDLV